MAPLFLLLPLLLLSPLQTHSLNQDGLFLLTAKSGLADPDGVLASWNPRDSTPCNWAGVSCDPSTRRVHSLKISGTNVSGPVPFAALCRLASLSSLDLSNSCFNSSLPADDIPSCRALRYLDLSENLLVGPIPGTLSEILPLRHLNLSFNTFSGDVPAAVGLFRSLETLVLSSNSLNGSIPSSLGNVTTLRRLHLPYNPLPPTRLRPELGNLTSLEELWLTQCNLVGDIPSSFRRLRSLTNLDLSRNGLTGPFPNWITEFTRVVQVELFQNSLTGVLPEKMSNMTALRRFDASVNEIGGTIPSDLCELPLESLHLYSNRLEGSLPESIARSPNLLELRVFNNSLRGSLPSELGKNSALKLLDVSENRFSGEIPANVCSKGVLSELLMIENSLSGSIPAGLGDCRSLSRLRLRNNRLSGEVPARVWGLPRLYYLDLNGNSLSGHISNAISTADNLSSLLISDNHFSGPIPSELGFLRNLLKFSGDGNNFTGEIPATLVNLTQLGVLDLSNNELSGEIPLFGTESWEKLNELDLSNNRLSGRIPHQIGSLPALNYLDLSGNQFSGEIPLEMQNLKLNVLNLSSNQLSGDVPPLYAKSMYSSSFLDNPGLCTVGLCPRGAMDRCRGSLWILRSIFILAGLVLTVGVLWFYLKYQKIKAAKKGLVISKWRSFHKLGFSEFEIIDCLSEDNVIGRGASGKVYKVVLSNGEVVAVKKLWGPKSKDNGSDGLAGKDTFEVEVETLGKIRHKNIVRLWCCFNGLDSKLLVYEYMPNGSLGDVLHSSKGGPTILDWPTRYWIARDAAEGLSYLHHDCVPPIVHRDVKSNNILLDGEYGARISDFGLAKFIRGVVGKGAESMSAIAGSYGYIAPEYAYTLQVNEKSDIYSFGVVILELVTGRRPVDPEFGEKDLVKWVTTTLDQKGVDHVLDPKLDSSHKDEICRVLDVGLYCTSSLPMNRPSMRWVVKMLQAASPESRATQAMRDGQALPLLSP